MNYSNFSLIAAILLSFASLSLVEAATTYQVTVGKDAKTGQKGVGFAPQSVFPSGGTKSGDTVQFNYASGNHSIKESGAFGQCTPIDQRVTPRFLTFPKKVDNSLSVDDPKLPNDKLFPVNSKPRYFYDDLAPGDCLNKSFVLNAPYNPPNSSSQNSNSQNSGGETVYSSGLVPLLVVVAAGVSFLTL